MFRNVLYWKKLIFSDTSFKIVLFSRISLQRMPLTLTLHQNRIVIFRRSRDKTIKFCQVWGSGWHLLVSLARKQLNIELWESWLSLRLYHINIVTENPLTALPLSILGGVNWYLSISKSHRDFSKPLKCSRVSRTAHQRCKLLVYIFQASVLILHCFHGCFILSNM